MTLRCSSESAHVRTQGCGALNAAAGFDHKISIRNSMLLCVTIGGNWRIHLSSSLSAASRPKCGTAWSRRTRGTAR
jgi:threonine dehydratase